MSITEEALRYRNEMNLGVFPVDGRTKRPRIAGWNRGGLRQEASILKVFGRWSEETVVGVPTGCLLEGGRYHYVLDVDERNGGLEAIEALPALPKTVTVRTPNGWHYWFGTLTPQPTVYREDGLELKGTDGYVIVPPAPGRYWIRNPFEFEIADSPAWLLPQTKTVQGGGQTRRVVNQSTGEVVLDLADPLQRMRRARPGNRRRTLLSEGGRVMYRVRGGLLDQGEALAALREAALGTGIEEGEVERLLSYVLRNNRLATREGEGGGASKGSCNTQRAPIGERELDVLAVICGVYLNKIEVSGFPFEAQAADIFSTRYLAGLCGLDHPPQVARSLERLCSAGLLWRSPVRKRIKDGQRACDRYRPTYTGLALSGSTRVRATPPQQLGSDNRGRNHDDT